MCDDLLSRFEQSVSFFYTTDLSKTASFWEQRVGLEKVLDQGTCRIYRISNDGFIGFCLRESVQVADVIITLVTKKVDEWCERLSGRGVEFEKEPAFNSDYNIYHAFFRDPNGYLVEVQRFEDPNWPGNEKS
mgnify:CR=1 FL=1